MLAIELSRGRTLERGGASRPVRPRNFPGPRGSCHRDTLLFEKAHLNARFAGSAARFPQQFLVDDTSSVLIWLDPVPAANMVKALRAAGFKGTLAGPGWLDCQSFIAAAGGALQGFVIPAILRGQENEKYFTRFAASYHERFGDEPSSMALYSYDAANLLIALLRRFGSDALHRGAPPGFELEGASGTLRFDALGNRKVTLQLLVADQGRFVPFRKRTAGQVSAGNSRAVDDSRSKRSETHKQ